MSNRGDNAIKKAIGPAKWAALIDDRVISAPSQIVLIRTLKEQGALPDNCVLVLDANSPDDRVLGDDEQWNLGAGNVFYTLKKDEVRPRGGCTAPAKLAFIVDDKPEVTGRADQTGDMLRRLFNLPPNVHLIRDHESPNDENIGPADAANFPEGPVFYTRLVEHKLQITVNQRLFTEHDGVAEDMNGLQIAALAYPTNASDTTVHEVSPHPREIPLNQPIKIKGGEVFDVVRKNVQGGLEEDPRVAREIGVLEASGQKMTRIISPFNGLIYRGLRVKPGGPVPTTDVLVQIPGSYPAQFLDGAYLPQGSPLIGRVKGQPQAPITAAGQQWVLISYHPHNGGGAPAWNPGVHGIHTYCSEILSWLYDCN